MSNRPQGLVLDTAALPTYGVGESRPGLSLDTSGRLIVTTGGGGGAFIVEGAATPSDTFANPTNAVTTWSLAGGWDRTNSVWQRIDAVDSNADKLAPFSSYMVQAQLRGNLSGNSRVIDYLAIGEQQGSPGAIAAAAFSYAYDGATFRALKSITPADNLANPTFVQDVFARLAGYDGATWDRAQTFPLDGSDFASTSKGLITASGLYGFSADQSVALALQVDGEKSLRVVVADPSLTDPATSPSAYIANGAVDSATVKASPGRLLAFDVINPDVDGFFGFVDKATAATNGNAFIVQFGMDVADAEPLSKVRGRGREFFGLSGLAFATGITWAMSSTAGTVTLDAPAAGFGVSIIYV